MNLLIIILGITVVLLCYYIYTIYTAAPTVLNNTYLGAINTNPQTVAPANIKNPYSANYTVAYWLYINNFSESIGKFLFYGVAGTSTPSTSDQTICSFQMDATAPVLSTSILTGTNANSNSNSLQSIIITDNLPIQTWVYVLVSVSSNYADCYLNGKLVVSQQLTKPSVSIQQTKTAGSSATSNQPTLNLIGGKEVDVYVTKLMWIPNPIDPQTAWTYYNQGNGNPTFSGASTYHLQMDVIKDSNVHTWRIF